MRLRLLIPTLAVLLLAAGAGITAHADSDRQSSFAAGAAALRAQWSAEEAQGLPATSVAPLAAQLAAQSPSASWWSPAWLRNDGQALLARLRSGTASAWQAALATQRSTAETVMAQWTAFAAQQSQWLSPTAVASAARWSAELGAATTPRDISALAASWSTFISQQHTAVLAALRAKLDAELQSAGGPAAVLASAQRLVAAAAADNLDAGSTAALAAQLNAEIAAGQDASATADRLLTAVDALQALVDLNNQVGGEIRPLLWQIDQARAEATPSAAALATQEAAVEAQFAAARDTTALDAVQSAVVALQSQVTAELAANQCGHSSVGSGKVITISLSLQEMVFYQDGCAVQATPVTTGRPALPTPTGTFHIFYKTTPFEMISPWPAGSPYYYPPTWVTWVMEFAAGGYFIHDAYWEPVSDYGPGGENIPAAASHGCVHTPHSVMQWAYAWTPVGTPVIISA
ncbi:MAG: L,D-transpeptidase [Candidatus Dormibacteria bacterium]